MKAKVTISSPKENFEARERKKRRDTKKVMDKVSISVSKKILSYICFCCRVVLL